MINPIFYIDFFKVGHVIQYPSDTTQVYSNWTPRSSRVSGQTQVVNLGFTYFAKDYLGRRFNEGFFARPWTLIEREYRQLISATLGIADPKTDHIRALHELGYLPLRFYSLPEGCSSPLNCPQIVVTNTLPEFFWLPNYLETIMSAVLWKPSTSATTAKRYRAIFEKFARESGETDLSFIDWQGHDFSFRGMSGVEDAILSGIGHLTCFSGTDSIPAIIAASEFYGADLSVGGSVPATEHSVMCSGTEDGEFETFHRLLTEIYPTGILSIVSDTWDLWTVLTDYVPRLKETILARKGKMVIRPDSGDPVKIMCGDPDSYGAAHSGTLRLLAEALGTTGGPGLPLINNAGAIYGDSITPERAEQILYRCVHELKLSPFNCVFGIGPWCVLENWCRSSKTPKPMTSGSLKSRGTESPACTLKTASTLSGTTARPRNWTTAPSRRSTRMANCSSILRLMKSESGCGRDHQPRRQQIRTFLVSCWRTAGKNNQ